MTIDRLIETLTAIRDASPDRGKASVFMVQTDEDAEAVEVGTPVFVGRDLFLYPGSLF